MRLTRNELVGTLRLINDDETSYQARKAAGISVKVNKNCFFYSFKSHDFSLVL